MKGYVPPPRLSLSNEPQPITRSITITEGISVKDLAEKLGIRAKDLIARLLARGVFATINQTLDTELGSEMAAPEREQTTVTRVEVVPPPTKFFDLVGPALIPLFQSLGTTFFVVILVIFFLIYHVDLRDRLVHLVGDTRVNLTTQTLMEAVQSVSRYLFLLSVVNAAFGALVTLGLVALGLPNALLWGMLAALLRFVPYVGTWIAALMPLLLSWAAVALRWSGLPSTLD